MPRLPILTAAVLSGLPLLGACGHSEPFTTAETRSDVPFSSAVPVRLTYAPGANTRPRFSEDGSVLIYAFARGTPDRDRCLATLPVGGGTRLRTFCWTAAGQDTMADGLEVGALATDGRLAFTRHTSRVINLAANDAALYVAPEGDVAAADRVLDLFVFQPAGGIAWDYLLDLTWSGPNELTALATDASIVNRCPPGFCPDTAFVGLHVATIQPGTETGTTTVTAVAVGPSAAGIAVDRSTSRRFIRYLDRVEELLADGTTAVVWTVPEKLPGEVGYQLAGLAAGGGRLVVSTTYTQVPGTPVVSSQLRRIDGVEHVVESRMAAGGIFGRVTLNPSGQRLIFEASAANGRHLYLVELQ
jgi:hypothetical protein